MTAPDRVRDAAALISDLVSAENMVEQAAVAAAKAELDLAAARTRLVNLRFKIERQLRGTDD